MRKYFDALSMVLSSSSSHRGGRLTRSCVGDTPAGVAARGTEVEKQAKRAAAPDCCCACSRAACTMAEDAGRARARAISGLVVAIADVWEWRGLMRRRMANLDGGEVFLYQYSLLIGRRSGRASQHAYGIFSKAENDRSVS